MSFLLLLCWHLVFRIQSVLNYLRSFLFHNGQHCHGTIVWFFLICCLVLEEPQDELHCEKVRISPIYHQLVTNHHYARKGQIIEIAWFIASTLLSEFALRTLTSSPNDFNWTILTILFAPFSKSSTFIIFPRLSDFGFMICFVLISFASMIHPIIFFILNWLVVSKLILEMMVSSVIMKLTLTSFFQFWILFTHRINFAAV